MRATSHRALAIAVLAAASARSVSAQPRLRTRQERTTVSLNAGVQMSSTSFDVSARHPVYLESSVVDTSYKYRGLVFDGGARYRLAAGFGVGIAVSWCSQPKDVAISAAIPHPFYFQMPRPVTGTSPGVRRDAAAAHLELLYSFRPVRRVEVTLGAGPSFFNVRQTIVDDVSYRDVYPFDAPSFSAASTQRISASTTGVSGSADVALRVSRHVGLGGMVRASKAEIQLTTPHAISVTASKAGGVHGAGGVRFYF